MIITPKTACSAFFWCGLQFFCRDMSLRTYRQSQHRLDRTALLFSGLKSGRGYASPRFIFAALQAGESGRTAARSILRAIWLFSALLALGMMVDYFAIIPQIVAKSRDLGFNPPVLRCEGNGAFTPPRSLNFE